MPGAIAPAAAAIAPTAPAAPAPVAPGGAPPASEATKPAAGAPAKPAETPSQKAERIRLKGKFGGKDQELEKTPDELVRDLQVLEGLRGERSKHLSERKTFEENLAAFQKNPAKFMKERGISLADLAKAEMAQEAELQAMTPEARRIRELEDQVAEHSRAETERVENEKVTAERTAHQSLVQETIQGFDAAIKLSGLPRSGALLKLYAEVQEMAVHAGEPPLTPQQMVTHGERLTIQRVGDLLKASAANEAFRQRNAPQLADVAKLVLPQLEGDALLGFLGNDMVMKVTAAAYAKHRGGSKAPLVQEPVNDGSPRQPAPPSEKRQSEWDVMDRLGA